MSKRARWLLLGAGVIALSGAALFAVWAVRERQATIAPAPTSRVPSSWREVRQGPGHIVHVEEQGLACEKCHEPGPTFAAPRLGKCADCHKVEASMRHALQGGAPEAALGSADCSACHSFRLGEGVEGWRCIECHETPQGAVKAIRAGAHDECSLCHQPHGEPSIAPALCTQCHLADDNTHAGIAATGSVGTSNCLTCHEVHAPPELASTRCTSCHDDKPHALFEGGHTQCASCHMPHGFDEAQVKTCRNCHTEQHVLAEQAVPQHAQCTTCHDPHAPKATSEATCKTCHTSVSPEHPPHEGGACMGCHAPHPPKLNAPTAADCTSCHAALKSDHAAHAGKAACTDCHAPHGFEPSQELACARCHAAQQTAIQGPPHDGHARCLGCHQGHPHDAQLPPAACTQCHSKVHPRAEHEECTSCHEPHSGTPHALEVSCKGCHAQEHASVTPIEQHRDCLGCHTPHEGKRLPAAQCKQCHVAQAKENHGTLSGGCTSCHGIHSDKGVLATPGCTSCHALAKLPGLHEQPGHQQCASCHDGAHSPQPWSERETCVACHKDRKDHVPEAALCQGCHVFER